MSNPNTPTAPGGSAGVISGDYAILKLALERAEAECARLRGLIAALHCVTSTQPLGRDCIEVKAGPRPEWKVCQVCKAKEAANG